MQADLGTKDEADCYWFCDEVKCAALNSNCFTTAEVPSLAWFHSNSAPSSGPRKYLCFHTHSNDTAVHFNNAQHSFVVRSIYINTKESQIKEFTFVTHILTSTVAKPVKNNIVDIFSQKYRWFLRCTHLARS